jgi:type IV pilus assembly protein PilE
MNSMRRPSGFSLIELLVVIMIIAILSAIAIPAYHRYVVRAHRTDATRALLELAGKQERFFYANNTYSDDLDALHADATLEGGFYTIEITEASASNFVLTATAAGMQQRDDAACQTLVLTKAGSWQSTGATANDPQCWGG